MHELAYDKETMSGCDIATYTKAMLLSGQEGTLGRRMAKLQFGNAMNENPVRQLDKDASVAGSWGQKRHENPGALGYGVGSLHSATKSISNDVKEQQELTSTILKSALGLIKDAKLGGPAVGITAGIAKDWGKFAVEAAMRDTTGDIAARYEAAALPTNRTTGELAVGDAVTNAFATRPARTMRIAQP